MDNREKFVADLLAIDLENAPQIAELCKSAELSEDATTAVETALRSLQAVSEEISPAVALQIAEQLGYKAPEIQVAAVEAPAATEEIDTPAEPEMSPEVAKAMKERDDKVVALEKALADEKEARLSKEYLEKAAGFNLPQDNLPAALRAIDEMGDAGETVMAILKHASAALGESALLEEAGTRGTGVTGDTGHEKALSIAKGLMEADKNLTEAEAYAKALADNKDLYEG